MSNPERYGHIEEKGREGYPLADWLFGHRLDQGQHWMEYLLEFLNVLMGFDFKLGQGISTKAEAERGSDYYETYRRFARLGLRRFVFYSDERKTTDARDDESLKRLHQILKNDVATSGRGDATARLELARQLLKSFSAVEESRSWFAKSLFPVHWRLLFFEALRQGATKWRAQPVPADIQAHKLDEGLTTSARNFFARGGEIYYLILSAGTEATPEDRAFITRRLQQLLTSYNVAIGKLAEIIDQSWEKEKLESGLREEEHRNGYYLGWIPDPSCRFYARIALDVKNLISVELDPLETLDLFAHLICFHLIEYIYRRSHPNCGASVCTQSGLSACAPIILVDCLERRGTNVIREVSASLYKEREQHQLQKARGYAEDQILGWAQESAGKPDFFDDLKHKAEKHFNVQALRPKTLEGYEQRVERVRRKFDKGELDEAGCATEYAEELVDLLFPRFRKDFLRVHTKLARNIGLVAPRMGRGLRYALGDTLLKALVFANIQPEGRMPYDDFLTRLYSLYGFVIGQREARSSGLYARRPINAAYYDENRVAFHTKLKNAGLLEEYSDATALVVNPFKRVGI